MDTQIKTSTRLAKVQTRELSKEGKTIIQSAQKSKVEQLKKLVKPEISKLYEESSKYFRNNLAEFVYYRTYSRWLDEEGRRES